MRTHSKEHSRPKQLPVYRERVKVIRGDARDYEKPSRADPRFIRGLGELLGWGKPHNEGEK